MIGVKTFRAKRFGLFFVLLLAGKLASAAVTSSGLSTTVTPNGNDFEISGGTQNTGNLFHSFGAFTITSPERAIFTNNPGSINNIIGRVTGGGVSDIDGTIDTMTNYPGASLWLINPAGIVFGANAQLDISGSFHASTADYLRFGTMTFGMGTTAGTITGSAFYAAPPSAFGFLDDTLNNDSVATIDVESGAGLGVNSGETLSLVGGDITITNGTLTANSGKVNIVAVDSTGEVGINSGAPDVSSFTQGGDVTLESGTDVIVDGTAGNTGGSVYIRGGSLAMNNFGTTISADNNSDTITGGRVNINVSGTASIDAATITQTNNGEATSYGISITADTINMSNLAYVSTSNYDLGEGGDISLSANTMDLDFSDLHAESYGAGDSGDIFLDATTSGVITNAMWIFADAHDDGDAGIVYITGGDWTVEDFSQVTSNADTTAGELGDSGVVYFNVNSLLVDNSDIRTDTAAGSPGDALGILIIAATDVTIQNGSLVSSSTEFGIGEAGFIGIGADTITIDNSTVSTVANAATFSGGGLNLLNATTTGLITNGSTVESTTVGTADAGAVSIQGGDWTIDGGSTVTTSSEFGSGEAGTVLVDVSSFTLDNAELSTINNAGPLGDGFISVEVDTTGHLLNGATIEADTVGAGPAGDIFLSDGDWTIEDPGTRVSSAQTNVNGLGDAGDITIFVDTLAVLEGAVITSSTISTNNTALPDKSDAGSIYIWADDGIDDPFTNDFEMNDNGTFSVPRILSNSSSGIGDAGTISILTGTMYLDWTDIYAQTNDGLGGNITIIADYATVTDVTFIRSDTFGTGTAGDIEFYGGMWALEGASQITSNAKTTATANAGNIYIDVDSLTVSGGTLLSTATEFGTPVTANAGDIDIFAVTDVTVQGFSTISSNTGANSDGNAGSIYIDAGGNLTIQTFSKVTSSTGNNSTGNAGDTGLYAPTISILNNSTVSSDSENGSGASGFVTIHATDGDLLTNSITVNNSTLSTSTNGSDATGYTWLWTTGTGLITNGAKVKSTTVGDGDAGGVYIQGGTQWTIEGTSTFVSTSQQSTTGYGDAGEIGLGYSPSMSPNREIGTLIIQDGATIVSQTFGNVGTTDVDASNAGNINFVVLDDLTIQDGSTVSTDTNLDSQGHAGGIDIAVGGDVIIQGLSEVTSSTGENGAGNAGTITIGTMADPVNSLLLDSGSKIATNTGLNSTGDAGSIEFNAVDFITLQGNSTVSSSSAQGTGAAGDISMIAGDITLDNGSIFTVTNDGPGGTIDLWETSPATGIITNGSTVRADTVGIGDAGDIFLRGFNWIIDGGSLVSSGSLQTGIGTGDAGAILIGVTGDINSYSPAPLDNFLLDNATLQTNTAGEGDAGSIEVYAYDFITLQDNSSVSSSSDQGTGAAGDVIMIAGDITLDDGDISTKTRDGQGGTIDLWATDPTTGIITNGSTVEADTSGSGTAGNIYLRGFNWIIDGTSVVSSGSGTGAGSAGAILIGVEGLLGEPDFAIAPLDNFLLDNATLQTNTSGEGDAGQIEIYSGLINLDNGASIASNTSGKGTGGYVILDSGSDVILRNGSVISTTTSDTAGAGIGLLPNNGDAGDIYIFADHNLEMYDSFLTSSTFGDGNAGSIFIQTGNWVYLLDSIVFAYAKTDEPVGGGNLDVITGILIMNRSTLDVSANFATGGNVSITADYFLISADSVIDVSSASGASGNLSVNAATVDLSGSLATIKVGYQDASGLLQEPCAVRGATGTSSFIVKGRSGIPSVPDGQQPASLMDENEEGENRSGDSGAQPVATVQPVSYVLAAAPMMASSECGG